MRSIFYFYKSTGEYFEIELYFELVSMYTGILVIGKTLRSRHIDKANKYTLVNDMDERKQVQNVESSNLGIV